MSPLERAALSVVEAVTVKGPAPHYHDAQLERLRREWPTLWRALFQLVSETRRTEHPR